jgi:acid phosphatase
MLGTLRFAQPTHQALIIMLTMTRHLLVIALFAVILAPDAYSAQAPRPDHVVVVIEENRGYSQIMDMRNSNSYIHALARRGVLFTQSYGVAHPSQPNYLALFSGTTQGVTSNDCPHTFSNDNLASSLLAGGLSFASYSESLPAAGDLSCSSGAYQRKHNPVANWQGARLPSGVNKRFADFPKDFAKLPTVSFVIPDQENDMHDGSFEAADDWLKRHIDPYVEWAMKHNSLLILTWDEDDFREGNHVVTILVGPMVKTGSSDRRIDHYNVLRTLLDFYGLPVIGASRDAEAIKGVWKKR